MFHVVEHPESQHTGDSYYGRAEYIYREPEYIMRALVGGPFQVRKTRTITIPNRSTAHCNTQEKHML